MGGLLLATPDAPSLKGDAYWQVVAFIVQHSPQQGSLALMLNRPTRCEREAGRSLLGALLREGPSIAERVLSSTAVPPPLWLSPAPSPRSLTLSRGRGGVPLPIDGMEPLRDAFAESRLYCGGFTAQQVVSLLHGERRLEGAAEVVPGLYLGGHEAAVAEVMTGGMQQARGRSNCVCWWARFVVLCGATVAGAPPVPSPSDTPSLLALPPADPVPLFRGRAGVGAGRAAARGQ